MPPVAPLGALRLVRWRLLQVAQPGARGCRQSPRDLPSDGAEPLLYGPGPAAGALGPFPFCGAPNGRRPGRPRRWQGARIMNKWASNDWVKVINHTLRFKDWISKNKKMKDLINARPATRIKKIKYIAHFGQVRFGHVTLSGIESRRPEVGSMDEHPHHKPPKLQFKT